jgi:hypothetical protein
MAFGLQEIKPLPPIVITTDGFWFEGASWAPVTWSAICRVYAYKVDLLTTDEIRLVIDYDDAKPKHIEVSEEQPGFEQFRNFIEQYFAFREGWWETVMKPAFSNNETVLYQRAEQGHAGDAGNPRA